MHNLSNATTGSNFWWWHDVTSIAQTGTVFVLGTTAKAQTSCNHGNTWPGQNGSSDSWGVWGDGRALLSSSFAYRVELDDATHARFYIGFPAYHFYSAGGASSISGASGSSALVFKCENVSRTVFLARVSIPGGGAGIPAVCTNVP